MKLKRTPADKWFSNCIRIADSWRCQACGKDYDGNHQGLDCSHFIGRANYSVRFNPMNAFAHCTSCHFRLGADPLAFVDFVEIELGKHGVDILRTLSRDIDLGRITRKADKSGEIAKHYRDQYKIFERRRANGVTKTFEIKAWQPEEIQIGRWALDNVS